MSCLGLQHVDVRIKSWQYSTSILWIFFILCASFLPFWKNAALCPLFVINAEVYCKTFFLCVKFLQIL